MQTADLSERCHINTNSDSDTFVGIKCTDGEININFPLGYNKSDKEEELRKDILLLISTLAKNTKQEKSNTPRQKAAFNQLELPIQSYIYLVRDYLSRGYYHEQGIEYKNSKTGKISWRKTIKTKKPYIQDDNVFYLDFITKKNTIHKDEIITLIHEYCVYESFDKIGWLFTSAMPQKPRIKKNDSLFAKVINDKLSATFNDKERMLFIHMLSVIKKMAEFQGNNYFYGTYRFEYVWESMIDKVFGISNKTDYFPKTKWKINGDIHDNTSLEPDTIMIYNNDVYILDAKYYKYGVFPEPKNLPNSASINKQITYGEYVSAEEKFKKIHGPGMKVFNAFLMPFNASEWKDNNEESMINIGEALCVWKDNTEYYHHIQGILLDVKLIMKITVRQDEGLIMKMAEIIKKGCFNHAGCVNKGTAP